MGLSLAGPSSVGLGLRALRWLACVDPVTDASGFPYCPSFDGGLGRCTEAVSRGRRHPPLRVGGRHALVPCVCSSFLAGLGGSGVLGAFWCAQPFLWPLCRSALLGPLRAGVAPFLLLCLRPFSLFFFASFPLRAHNVFCFIWFLAPVASGIRGFFSLSPPPVFSFLFFCAPPFSLAFFGFRPRVPWALALCVVCFVRLPLLGSPCALAAFVSPAWPLAGPLWLLPLPPPFVSRGFRRCRSLRCFFFPFLLRSCLLAGRSSAVLAVCCPPPPPLVCFAGLPLLGSSCALAAFVVPAQPSAAPFWLLPPPPLLCLAVFVAAARCSFFFFPSAALLLPACLALVGGSRLLLPPPPAPLVGFVGLLLLGSPCALAAFVFPALPRAPPWWFLPPPFCVSWFLSLLLGAPFSFFSSAALLLPACLALVGGFCRLLPPPPGARVVPCAVWCCCAVLPFRWVFCGAVLP